MTDKRELIKHICKLDGSEKPEFLAIFSEEELKEYLGSLMERQESKELAVSHRG